jgi:hypothetical protein
LLGEENTIALVYEQNNTLDGFLFARLLSAPPVYDPGGLTCLIDDFTVNEGLWLSAGMELLAAAREAARARGAVQVVVVCAHLDEPKRRMLAAAELSIGSEWYVSEA